MVGAARSGIAAAQLLVRRGATVVLSERRVSVPEAESLSAMGVRLELGGHRTETLTSADVVVCSPGVPLAQPAIEAARAVGVEVIGELEMASRWLKGRMIAITGTKGKSTTTTIVGRMFEAAGRRVLVSGNIGVPLSAHVDESSDDTVHVVEASSFQLEATTTFRPWIAAWLNVSADHLDRHPSTEAYIVAKARVFANQQPSDWLVVNADDDVVMARSAGARSQRKTFSANGADDADVVVDEGWIVDRYGTGAPMRVVTESSVRLRGRHMRANALAAAGIGCIAGLQPDAMDHAFRSFTGLPHVMQDVGQIGDVRFINDSKATNPAAALCAIESFDGGVVAIIGGVFKGGDFASLRQALADRGRGVVAIGQSAELVSNAVAGVVPVVSSGSLREAVTEAYAMSEGQGVVLLAPACASFDWFRDYADRGEQFKEEVIQLQKRVKMREL